MSCLHDTICDTEDCEDHNTIEALAGACPPVPPALAETAGLIREWYRLCERFGVGGPLHVQLDDDNLDDNSLTDACYDRMWEFHAEDRTPERYDMGKRILGLLRPMTEAQRTMTTQAAHDDRMAHLFGVIVRGRAPYA